MDEPRCERTAYHEAGHAVVALALGRQVRWVSIVPERTLAGICEFQKAVIRPTEDWVERELMIALAGLAAQAGHEGDYDWGGAEHDLRYARSLALKRAGTERAGERLTKRVLSKTENLLGRDGHWEAVEQIAAALMREGEISGRAARHLFDEACRRHRD